MGKFFFLNINTLIFVCLS